MIATSDPDQYRRDLTTWTACIGQRELCHRRPGCTTSCTCEAKRDLEPKGSLYVSCCVVMRLRVGKRKGHKYCNKISTDTVGMRMITGHKPSYERSPEHFEKQPQDQALCLARTTGEKVNTSAKRTKRKRWWGRPEKYINLRMNRIHWHHCKRSESMAKSKLDARFSSLHRTHANLAQTRTSETDPSST